MTRKEFLRLSSILGLTLPFPSLLFSQGERREPPGSVLIIGAGAAGLSAGYLLAQQNIDFQIVEASDGYGGRIKQDTTFTDFPLPLGGEWLHVAESELSAIVNDAGVNLTPVTRGYDAQDRIATYRNRKLTYDTMGTEYRDRKFIGITWLGFFETYILPAVASRIAYNAPITAIDCAGHGVTATTQSGRSFRADRVIVTVPLKILQEGFISFKPELPSRKQKAIRDANIWGGIKVFLEFTEKFYPVFLEFADSETSTGQRTYYDAAYGQASSANILGLFAVGQQAEPYQNLRGDAQRDYILNELDAIFNHAASRTYVKHRVQNWNEEPYARAAYLADVAASATSRRMAESVDDKLYFAGDAYTQENDWSAVHNAARSARAAVHEILS
ncbi:MAG: FAD-dependent oxidoreductase [Bacteroidota bacterium]